MELKNFTTNVSFDLLKNIPLGNMIVFELDEKWKYQINALDTIGVKDSIALYDFFERVPMRMVVDVLMDKYKKTKSVLNTIHLDCYFNVVFWTIKSLDTNKISIIMNPFYIKLMNKIVLESNKFIGKGDTTKKPNTIWLKKYEKNIKKMSKMSGNFKVIPMNEDDVFILKEMSKDDFKNEMDADVLFNSLEKMEEKKNDSTNIFKNLGGIDIFKN